MLWDCLSLLQLDIVVETQMKATDCLLSVVIPVYNERPTIEEILCHVQAVDWDKEIIVVDDGSTDGTRDFLKALQDAIEQGENHLRLPRCAQQLPIENISIVFQPQNRGKGAALRRGFELARGNVVVVQDADLEYDPQDYFALLEPIRAGKADVVYGSRFLGGGPHRVLYFWHRVGNAFLTLFSNMLTDLNLTDMETCYKMFRREVIQKIEIQEDRFGFEPEITAKVARLGCRIYEVPISYHGRTYAEGKKIGWKDGARALWCIVKYNVFKRQRQPVSLQLAHPTRVEVATSSHQREHDAV